METASTSGPTGENSPATGSATKCRAKVFSRGMMEDGIKVSTTTTKSMVMESSPGLMAASMTAPGKTGSRTDWASTTM